MTFEHQTSIKKVLITGGTDGIGRETALKLASLGFQVWIAGRSESKASEVIFEAEKISKIPVTFLKVDLSLVSDTRKFIETILPIKFDYFIMNAGVMNPKSPATIDGLETTLMTNLISASMIVNDVLSNRQQSDDPIHFVFVTSILVKVFSSTPIGTRFFFPRSIDSWMETTVPGESSGVGKYVVSKIGMIQMAMSINRAKIEGVTATAVHPGCVMTNMIKSLPARQQLYLRLCKRFMTSKDDAGVNVTRAMLSPLSSNMYYETSNGVKLPTILTSQKSVDIFNKFISKYEETLLTDPKE